MAKKKKKASRSSNARGARAVKQVQDMIEDMKEAGMILSGVAKHFHHRVRSASQLLLKGHSKAKKHAKKKNKKAKKRRR